MKRAIAIGLASMSLLWVDLEFSPAYATQQLSCSGNMNNGRAFTAQFLDGRFTQIRWEKPGQPPQVSQLTFDSTNPQGQPVYRGSFQGATAVTLVDVSGGDVRSGSEISVGVEEWGWARGVCGTSGGNSGTGTTQNFSCNGRMKNGRTFSAEFLDGRFTQIRWEQSGQPPQVSRLTFDSTNAQGQSIYRGSFQAATAVTLIDVSGGNVQSGSEISVGVEEWGWARGICSAASGGNSGG